MPQMSRILVLVPTRVLKETGTDQGRGPLGPYYVLLGRYTYKFSAAWRDTLSVLAARGRAQVSVAAAITDWPKRIRDMRYADQDDQGPAD